MIARRSSYHGNTLGALDASGKEPLRKPYTAWLGRFLHAPAAYEYRCENPSHPEACGDWHAAELQPPKGPYQWQDWSFAWEATDVGRHSLRARATDAAGNVQPEVPPWNRLGYGNNAVEVLYVDVD